MDNGIIWPKKRPQLSGLGQKLPSRLLNVQSSDSKGRRHPATAFPMNSHLAPPLNRYLHERSFSRAGPFAKTGTNSARRRKTSWTSHTKREWAAQVGCYPWLEGGISDGGGPLGWTVRPQQPKSSARQDSACRMLVQHASCLLGLHLHWPRETLEQEEPQTVLCFALGTRPSGNSLLNHAGSLSVTPVPRDDAKPCLKMAVPTPATQAPGMFCLRLKEGFKGR